MLNLSKRLLAIADLATPCRVVADVGCDHGFLSIYLLQEGIAERAVAMDVRTGPLARAQEHIAECRLQERMDARLGDGLEKLSPGEADTVVIAGMGGNVMLHILTEGRDILAGGPALVLQPQSEIAKVRRFLDGIGYQIVREDMVEEEGKFYPMMRAIPRRKSDLSAFSCGQSEAFGTLTPEQEAFGPCLLAERNLTLARFLVWRKDVLTDLRGTLQKKAQGSAGAKQRMASLEDELALLQKGLDCFKEL